jgi:HK97 family phage major capsid protein
VTIDELIEQSKSMLATLNEREQAGEKVDPEEKERLQKQTATLEGRKADESELARLRREARERTEQEKAASIVEGVKAAVVQDIEAEQQRVETYVHELLKKELGGGGMDDVVSRVLANHRTPSRFAGEGADLEHVKGLAEGGRTDDRNPAGQRRTIEVAASKECEAIVEGKNLVHFMSIIARKTRNLPLSDGEGQFLNMVHKAALAEGTDASGGYLVLPQWMPDILAILRAQAVVRRANPRIVPFNKQMNQTSLATGSTAYYTPENANIPTSDLTFAQQAILTPHNLTAMVAVSNYLLNDAPAAEAFVRDDITQVIALREDLAFIQGAGTGGEPLGLKNKAGVTSNPVAPGANGFQATLSNLRTIRNQARLFNLNGAGRFVWFFHPAFVSYLETLQVQYAGSPSGQFLADANILRYDENTNSGVIDGVPFFTTTQIPINITTGTSTNTTYLLYTNIAETIVGENQQLTFDVSSEASYTPDGGTTWINAFQTNQTLFRAVLRHDITHRRPNQIVVQNGVIIP